MCDTIIEDKYKNQSSTTLKIGTVVPQRSHDSSNDQTTEGVAIELTGDKDDI